MAVAKSLEKYAALERECNEFANSANKPKEICEIRPHLHLAQVQVFALFAMRIPGLCYSHRLL